MLIAYYHFLNAWQTAKNYMLILQSQQWFYVLYFYGVYFRFFHSLPATQHCKQEESVIFKMYGTFAFFLPSLYMYCKTKQQQKSVYLLSNFINSPDTLHWTVSPCNPDTGFSANFTYLMSRTILGLNSVSEYPELVEKFRLKSSVLKENWNPLSPNTCSDISSVWV